LFVFSRIATIFVAVFLEHMREFFVMAISLISLFSCSNRIEHLSVDKFAAAIADGAHIVDVRTPEEFAEGSIPGAVNVDWEGGDFLNGIDILFDSSDSLYIYCRSGRRSAAAAKALRKEGYKVYNLLGGIEAWTKAGKNIDQDFKYAASLLPAGTPVPGFVLDDIEGNPVNISDFRGKSVVLVFWASWCPDCRAEVPELKEMYAAADSEKVQFVSVSFDREFDALCSFAAENELPGVQLFDPAGKKDSKVAVNYGVKWIPSLYLIDPDGKVVLSTVMAWKVAAALDGKVPVQGRSGQLCSDESCAI
jgi:rhodanese-related sulfurtransferase/peroxiredoxin